MASNKHVAAKIFFVAFWVSFITLAKNQDCHKENIRYENVQKIDLHESYVHGQTVKLNCATGYVGLLKLECQNGLWKKIAGRDCKKRACGHPGDTPNGHFKLVKETEFVFGATVEYTCRTGYTMASRINYRNCRSQGWDNDVPVCEVVKCPIISNLGDMIATGNIEEASYGDVIHFECASNKMLEGQENIHCTDNGQWSGTIPKCKEIQCHAPEILHGSTRMNTVYNEHNILQYSCDKGYRPRPGTSKCTKNGWIVQPACEEIQCHSPEILHGSARLNTVYNEHDILQYSCDKGYRPRPGTSKCTENGWIVQPACEEITCRKPEVANGVVSSNGRIKNIGFKQNDKLWIWCNSGYEPEKFDVTCNKNGEWDKMHQCKPKQKSQCGAEPSVQNGFIHKLNERYYYSCDPGYKAFDSKLWGVVSCTGGQWSSTPFCIAEGHCGQIPNGISKQNQAKEGYKEEVTKVFECESKPCCFKCIAGKWESCESTKCGTPSPVDNAVITNYQEKVKYACRENYIIKGDPLISCINSKWGTPPTCELQANCPEPSVQNGFIHKLAKGFSYSCDSGYKAFDEKWWGVVSCTEGQWSSTPLCIAEGHCGQIPNGISKQNQAKEGYKEGVTKVFECESKPCCFKCIGGKWEKCESTKCGTPSPVDNAVITNYQEKVKYACRENYIIKKDPLISCINSKWGTPPTCESLSPLHTDQETRNMTIQTEEPAL